jgi:large repetitive protein
MTPPTRRALAVTGGRASYATMKRTLARAAGKTSGAKTVSIGYSVRSGGSLTADDFVLVDADQTPPAVAVTNPAPNMLVRGTVPLAATASDASGIAKVEFW